MGVTVPRKMHGQAYRDTEKELLFNERNRIVQEITGTVAINAG